MSKFEVVIEEIKQEILQDITDGVLPETVGSFTDLHDYVDANEYGGLTDESNPNSKISIEDIDYIQTSVSQWLINKGVSDG